MNRFLAWLDGLSNIDATILVLLVFIVSIIVILLTTIAVMILRGNR